MKVLFDVRYTRLGWHDGISRYGARLVEEFGKLHPVTMVIQDERQLEMLPDLPWVLGPVAQGAGEPFAALALNKFEPDVVFSTMQTIGPAFRKYALVTTVHDLIYYTHRTPPRDLTLPIRLIWRGYHLWWGFQRALLNQADAHLVDSETTRELMERYRLTNNPVRVVLPGTDHPAAAPPRQVPTTRDLIYMGSFMPYKNVDLLVRAMGELTGYRLLLMSRISPAEQARLSALTPAGSLVFANGVSDEEYGAALLGATALVSASRDEGFGLPAVEAQTLGTPVLLSDIPIFREIAGPSAGFFDPSSVESFVAAVRELDDPAEWARRSAASILWSARYDWGAAAKSLLEFLTETVERRAASKRS